MNLKWQSLKAKYETIRAWHRWFAWRPVRISDDELLWLEWVERKIDEGADAYRFVYRKAAAK